MLLFKWMTSDKWFILYKYMFQKSMYLLFSMKQKKLMEEESYLELKKNIYIYNWPLTLPTGLWGIMFSQPMDGGKIPLDLLHDVAVSIGFVPAIQSTIKRHIYMYVCMYGCNYITLPYIAHVRHDIINIIEFISCSLMFEKTTTPYRSYICTTEPVLS